MMRPYLNNKPKSRRTKPFSRIRSEHVRIATDLLYPSDIIDSIKQAQTEDEIIAIMEAARHNL